MREEIFDKLLISLYHLGCHTAIGQLVQYCLPGWINAHRGEALLGVVSHVRFVLKIGGRRNHGFVDLPPCLLLLRGRVL